MAEFRALIVGAGSMGRVWANNLKSIPEDVSVVGWVDIRPDAAAAAGEELKFSLEYAGDDLGRALAEVKPDFVVDVSIPEAHHDVTLTALAAGVPVLGEKPMADSMERARAMVTASEKSGKLYMVSQSRRYDANLQAFRKLVESNLGTLGILNSDFYLGPHFGGFREDMRSPLILDMAIHTFDAARYLCGLDPVAVYCDEFNPPWSWYKGDASATAIFEMQGGLRYTYSGSWCSDGRPTSWEAEWRVTGEHGSATWDGKSGNPPVGEVVKSRSGLLSEGCSIIAEVTPTPSGIAGSVRDFLNGLRTGATPMGECHDNIKSLAMVFAAMESSDLGKRIPINDFSH